MSGVRIHLFGGLEIRGEAGPLGVMPTRKASSLLCYLIYKRDRAVHRDTLCSLLWPECAEAEARKALRLSLWRIRSVLEPDEASRGRFLRSEGAHIAFQADDATWIDVAEFEKSLSSVPAASAGVLPDEQADALARAIALYVGEFAEGLHDDWCVAARQHYRLDYLNALERLMAHHSARGEWRPAIALGRRILEDDPIREHIHRELMLCHAAMGDRPSALRQYEECARLIADELGVEPMEATRSLYLRIRSDDVVA